MNKKVMIIAPVALLLVVGLAYMMVLKPKPPPPDEAMLKKEPGPVYSLVEPFVVNLADRGGVRHFAKVGVALRFSEYSASYAPAPDDKVAKEKGIKQEPEIRDIVISTLQRQTADALSTAVGREDVKKTIVKKVNKTTDLYILDVYYTEFAVQ